MIPRQLSNQILNDATKYPVISITGPRQSGKTTLVKSIFPKKKYTNLENFEDKDFALSDPRGFLTQSSNGIIIDEIQHIPELFSYIQVISDEQDIPGYFVITSSQNFSLLEKISQSLAGRVSVFTLLPFSMQEITKTDFQMQSLEEHMYKGFYPRLHDRNMEPSRYYNNYIQTYIERDVRNIKSIHDLNAFQTFLKLCAGRVGQLVNFSSLADDVGINHNTAKSWLSILEASYIIYLLKPHHQNFNKRLVKMPKMYFHDTGLLCVLLSINQEEELISHHLRGHIFENFIISEFMKVQLHRGLLPNLYFWRDKHGKEIDCIIEKGQQIIPVEIKSGNTISNDYFKNLKYYNDLADIDAKNSYLIYGGDSNQDRAYGKVRSWRVLEEKDLGLLQFFN